MIRNVKDSLYVNIESQTVITFRDIYLIRNIKDICTLILNTNGHYIMVQSCTTYSREWLRRTVYETKGLTLTIG